MPAFRKNNYLTKTPTELFHYNKQENVFLAIAISSSSALENCCPSTSLNLTCENEDICEKNSNMFGLYKTRFPTGTFLTCYGYYIDQLYERSVNNATYYLYLEMRPFFTVVSGLSQISSQVRRTVLTISYYIVGEVMAVGGSSVQRIMTLGEMRQVGSMEYMHTVLQIQKLPPLLKLRLPTPNVWNL